MAPGKNGEYSSQNMRMKKTDVRKLFRINQTKMIDPNDATKLTKTFTK